MDVEVLYYLARKYMRHVLLGTNSDPVPVDLDHSFTSSLRTVNKPSLLEALLRENSCVVIRES